jgi:uncharacterized membrane protein
MALLALGLVLFLGIHSVSIVAPAWRNAQVARRGEHAWKGVYSLVSLAGLVLLIYGYGAARQSAPLLYAPPQLLHQLSLLLMLPVFPLLFAAYMPGRIQRGARHPFLLAVLLWATAHLLSNGTLADVLLFGAFLVWTVADLISVQRRAVPHKVPGAPPAAFNDVVAIVGGLLVYVGFLLWAHRWMTGVSLLA